MPALAVSDSVCIACTPSEGPVQHVRYLTWRMTTSHSHLLLQVQQGRQVSPELQVSQVCPILTLTCNVSGHPALHPCFRPR